MPLVVHMLFRFSLIFTKQKLTLELTVHTTAGEGSNWKVEILDLIDWKYLSVGDLSTDPSATGIYFFSCP